MKHFLAIGILLTGIAQAATIPAGTELQVRLLTEVSSDKASGQPVRAVVTGPIFIGGVPVVASGTEIAGKTSDVAAAIAATDGAAEQPAKLRVEFTTIEDSSGHAKPLSCVLASIDNARESLDQSGLITGITASQTYEARLDQGIGKLAARNQQFAQLLSGVESAFVKKVDPSIDFKPGVDFSVKLTKPLEWDAPATANLPGEITPAEALVQLVNAEPFRTAAQSPPKPSDLTNLMFIGTEDQVKQAFKEAGWFSADSLSEASKMETARAIIEDRGYSEAPVSVLFLQAKPPSLTFQKQNDTFAMRHHIRVWLRPDTFNRKPVWVAAATHDTGITFSEVSKNFTHGIDPNIDKERAKVVNDLLFTKHVRALALVDRTGIPQDVSNATGDKLQTDDKMAVLEF
ncbi:MAG: LssY C-terminal domain-containing protein [Acidobacteriota bacterium]|nr:LssY C-terminal domain-containing protein [Acidobacteriota bacterium]